MSYSHGFTPQNLQSILWKQSMGPFLNYETHHSKYGAKSPLEQIQMKLIHLEDPISSAVKRLEAKAIEESLEECFQDKWMKSEYPNVPAVEKCREMVRHRVMGEYLEEAQNVQMKSKVELMTVAHDTVKCVESNPGNLMMSIQCLEDLKSNLDKASTELVGFMKKQYSGFMSQ